MRHLIVASLLLFLAWSSAYADSTNDACRVVDRYVSAFNANDLDKLVAVYAPDVTTLSLFGKTFVEGRETLRGYFANIPGSGFTVALGERHAVQVGNGVVLCAGFYTFTLIRDGKPAPTPARYSMVTAKRGNTWLILHHHASLQP